MKLILTTVLALMVAMPALAEGPPSRVEQGMMRIELTGSQRMLSQRILRNTCFIVAGLGEQDLVDEIAGDVAAFDKATETVLEGDETLGLQPERSPIIRSDYNDRILLPWQAMRIEALAVAARGIAAPADIAELPLRSESMLADLNAAVAHYEEKYSRGSRLSPELSRTANVYARQRMLSVRIAAMTCLISVGMGNEQTVEALRDSYATMAAAYSDMAEGNVDQRIIAAPDVALPLIRCGSEALASIRPHVETALSGTPLDQAALGEVLRASQMLMALSQESVSVFEAHITGSELPTASCAGA